VCGDTPSYILRPYSSTLLYFFLLESICTAKWAIFASKDATISHSLFIFRSLVVMISACHDLHWFSVRGRPGFDSVSFSTPEIDRSILTVIAAGEFLL
jgi:hypothetical protein